MEAIRTGNKPENAADDEIMAYAFATELLNTKRISDQSFSQAVEMFGEEGLVEIVGACGYYTLVGLTLNVAAVPLPDGEPLPFPE